MLNFTVFEKEKEVDLSYGFDHVTGMNPSPKSLIGKKAPAFKLQGLGPKQNIETYSLNLLKDADSPLDFMVLFFYPKDDTPGCTREAIDFTQHATRFKKLNTLVLGVSRDSCERHASFVEKHQLGVALLSDPDLKVAQAYGAYGKKVLYGKESMGVIRSTFIIEKSGVISEVFSPVNVDGHAAKVLETIKAY